MKVLIADKLSETVSSSLQALGLDVESRPELSAEDIPEALDGVGVLIVRSTRVSASAMERANNLALVIRAGAGVNTIDLPSASARGIYVTNCPGKNTAAVAELAVGLLIAADRQIVDATITLREGSWQKKRFGAARGLCGRTLGILGFGAIGQAVAARAAGLGMEVCAWSRSLSSEVEHDLGIEVVDSPIEVARKSDAVSVHLALCEETRSLLDENFFAALKPGAIFVNTARGELVDTPALLEALETKQLRVGLDVFAEEPSGGTADFFETDLARSIICTPHIGASTGEASEAIATEVVHIVEVYLKTGHPPVAVNLCARSYATCHLVVRHYNRVGVLAGILDGLRSQEINVEEMDNVIFDGEHAACCTLLLSQEPSVKFMKVLEAEEAILHVALRKE
ncbi:MAG: NAD(P)-dependent oxidoreductase [Pirellulales bacterium]|nr:NAD(P)-dependent oxidoreductase [Pirellulales bacterium]